LARVGLPNDRELQRLRADALLAVNRGTEALEAFDQYLGGGSDAEVYRLRGFERAKADDPAGALADYTSALALDPNSPSTRARRGWSFLGDSARLAFRDFDEAIKLDSRDGDLYNGRGYAHALLGRHREAVEDAERALRIGARPPDDLRARLGLLSNAACIYALAAGSVAHGPGGLEDPDLATRHRDRAVELVRKALDLLTADTRAPFLRQVVEDPAFLSIRDHPPLVKLVSEFAPPAPSIRP
jgi:tetratricopeptide (TPR) repeat protein